jgi:hypothetical protein
MKQKGESQFYNRSIQENMVTDENDINLGRMKNTELTRLAADQERYNRQGFRPMSDEEANKATDRAAKSGMSYDEAARIEHDDPDPNRRGLDHKGNVRRGHDSDVINTTLDVANQYDELQRKAAEISERQLDPPKGTSNPADQK